MAVWTDRLCVHACVWMCALADNATSSRGVLWCLHLSGFCLAKRQTLRRRKEESWITEGEKWDKWLKYRTKLGTLREHAAFVNQKTGGWLIRSQKGIGWVYFSDSHVAERRGIQYLPSTSDDNNSTLTRVDRRPLPLPIRVSIRLNILRCTLIAGCPSSLVLDTDLWLYV